jgi:hypothetical protein
MHCFLGDILIGLAIFRAVEPVPVLREFLIESAISFALQPVKVEIGSLLGVSIGRR